MKKLNLIKSIAVFFLLLLLFHGAIAGKFSFYEFTFLIYGPVLIPLSLLFFYKRKNNSAFVNYAFLFSVVSIVGIFLISGPIAKQFSDYNKRKIETLGFPPFKNKGDVIVFYGIFPTKIKIGEFDTEVSINGFGGARYIYDFMKRQWTYDA